MPHNGAPQLLSEHKRKEIFFALVDAQDHEMSVAQSRQAIAERFDVSESQLRDIEREGLDRDWLESSWRMPVTTGMNPRDFAAGYLPGGGLPRRQEQRPPDVASLASRR